MTNMSKTSGNVTQYCFQQSNWHVKHISVKYIITRNTNKHIYIFWKQHAMHNPKCPRIFRKKKVDDMSTAKMCQTWIGEKCLKGTHPNIMGVGDDKSLIWTSPTSWNFLVPISDVFLSFWGTFRPSWLKKNDLSFILSVPSLETPLNTTHMFHEVFWGAAPPAASRAESAHPSPLEPLQNRASVLAFVWNQRWNTKDPTKNSNKLFQSVGDLEHDNNMAVLLMSTITGIFHLFHRETRRTASLQCPERPLDLYLLTPNPLTHCLVYPITILINFEYMFGLSPWCCPEI